MALLDASPLDVTEKNTGAESRFLVAFTWNESQGYYEGTGNIYFLSLSLS